MLLFSCTNKSVTGTTDETVVTSAHVYNPDRSPAVNATVKVFAVSDTSRIPVYETATDNTGKYHLAIGNGVYNVLVGKDSLGAFQDSVIVQTTYSTLSNDTLGRPGVLCGVIVMQPMHNPATATVQILGTDKYSNVLENGSFVIEGIPAGEYSLRSVTTLPEYTPTFTNITMAPTVKDTLHDTIDLIYTGIPVVLNLKASYDTLAGIVTLRWDTLSYFNLRDFLIYRDQGQILTPSTTPVGTSPTCTFADTIGNSFSGSSALFTYRVAVRSKDFSIGQTYEEVQVTGVSPFSIYLRDTLPVYPGVPRTLSAFVFGSAGSAVVKYAWDIGGKGVFSQSQGPETTFVMHDTVIARNYMCILKTTVGTARTILDTVNLPVYLQWQKVAQGFDSINALNYHAVALPGKMVAFIDKSDIPNVYKTATWQTTDGQTWTKITDSLEIPFSPYSSKSVIFLNRICLVDDEGYLWTSIDGVGWSKDSIAPLCGTLETGAGFTPAVGNLCPPALFVDGATIVLQPFPGTRSTNLLTSTDLVTWDSASGYQMRSLVSDYADYNGTLAVVGFDWNQLSSWAGIKISGGISYLACPDAGSSSSPYEYNIIAYKNTFIYSNSAYGNLWALANGSTLSWFQCSDLLTGIQNSYYSLVVFNNELYMISSSGVFKAAN
jgi:hypothetical protein